jgi:hypothetical protein
MKKIRPNFYLDPKRRLYRWIFVMSGVILCAWGIFATSLSADTHQKILWIVDISSSMSVQDIR